MSIMAFFSTLLGKEPSKEVQAASTDLRETAAVLQEHIETAQQKLEREHRKRKYDQEHEVWWLGG